MNKLLFIVILIPSICFSGEIADKFKKQGFTYKDYKEGALNSSSPQNSQIDKIGIERTECYGTCPVYSATISKDGTVKYFGFKYIELQGMHTGKLKSIYKLNNLFEYIESINYFSYAPGYTVGITDNPSTYTMVEKDGKTKIIYNYANSAPNNIWVMEQIIDHLLDQVVWESK